MTTEKQRIEELADAFAAKILSYTKTRGINFLALSREAQDEVVKKWYAHEMQILKNLDQLPLSDWRKLLKAMKAIDLKPGMYIKHGGRRVMLVKVKQAFQANGIKIVKLEAVHWVTARTGERLQITKYFYKKASTGVNTI